MTMDSRLSRIYYSPGGYWKGIAAVKKLASAAGVSLDAAKNWLKKQAIWQIYLPAPRHIPRPKFDVQVPNEVHQADLLFLPHDRVGRKTYKYALTVVDIASRYKEAESLTTKGAAEVADALSRIYKRGPLTWPKMLQVDPGREFMGAVSQLLASHNVEARRGRVGSHRDQGIVERWNRTLSERLFGHQYAQEMRLPVGERSTEWVRRLPALSLLWMERSPGWPVSDPPRPSRQSLWVESPLLRFPAALLDFKSRSSLRGLAFASSISPANSRVGCVALQTLCGPSGCTG